MKDKTTKPKKKFGRDRKSFSPSRLKVGDEGPDFTGLTKEMKPFAFYREGKDNLKIINSIRTIDTAAGLRQFMAFNEITPNEKEGLFSMTVSTDLPFAIERFCSGVNIEGGRLVSDYMDLSFGRGYGFADKSTRLLSNGIVVLDRDNSILFIQYMKNPDMVPDFEHALAAAEKVLYDEALLEVDKLLCE